MLIDFPGLMTEFTQVKPGDVFIYFDDNYRSNIAMKIFDAVSAEESEAVLSFSTAAYPSMTPPIVVGSQKLQNRDVCVLRDVVVRPRFDVAKLRGDSPPEQEPGPVIVASDGVFIRAWLYGGQQTIEVDLATGAVGPSFAHPGSVWVDYWEVVLPGLSGERVLCERGVPAAT